MPVQNSLFPTEVVKQQTLACRGEWIISPMAHRLCLLMALQYQAQNKEKPLEKFEYLKIRTKDIIGTSDGGNQYDSVRSMFDAISDARVIIHHDNGDLEQFAVFKGRSYYSRKNDEISACFNEDMKDVYILLSKDNPYARLIITEMLSLPNTKFARLVYQYFKSFQYLGQAERPIDEVKSACGGKHYVKWKDFDRWVLAPSHKTINENTTLKFDYVPVRAERGKVTALRFWFPKQKQLQTQGGQ